MIQQKLSVNFLVGLAVFLAIVLVIVAPRSTVLVLIGLTAWRLYALYSREMVFKPVWQITILFLVFAFWSGITIFWSDVPSGSLNTFAGFLALGVIGFLGFSIQCSRDCSSDLPLYRFVLMGVVVGVFILFCAFLYAGLFNDSLWGSYYFDPLTVLNNSSVILALCFWPVLRIINERTNINPWIFGVPYFGFLVVLSSTSAVVAVASGGLLILAWKVFGHRIALFCGTICTVLILFSPALMDSSGIDYYDDPARVNAPSELPYSVRHRLAMWSFVIDKIEVHPYLGWGVGMSRYIPKESRRILPNMEIMPLHPHSLILQTRLELGIPGVVLLASIVLLIMLAIARNPILRSSSLGAVSLASAFGWFFIANVSYGMWQSWWLASAFLLAIVLRIEMYSASITQDS